MVSASGRPVRGLKGRRSRTASFSFVRNPSASGRALNDFQCSRPSTAPRTRTRTPAPGAARVLRFLEEPVGQRAGLERLAVLAPSARPPDPEPPPGAVAADLLDV